MNSTIPTVRKIAGLATNVIERIWIFIHPKIDVQSSILLVGAPRSGTTWVMEIIEALGNYRVVFEPFHTGFYPMSRRFISRFLDDPAYRIVYRPYLPIDYEDSNLRTYLDRVLRGRVAGYWYSPPTRLAKNLRWIKADKVIVKDVWIPRLLPWITNRFYHEIRKTFLLIRHPCAIIESQIRTCIGNPLCRRSKHIVKKAILKQLNDVEELRDLADNIRHKLMNINKSEELLAAIWSMDYFVPLYHNTRNPYNVIVYEDLVLHPASTIKSLVRFLGLDGIEDSEITKLIAHRSATARDVTNKALDNVYKWRKRLSRRQIESILRVTHTFNLTFYDKSIEPNYDLKNWKP